MTKKTTIRFPTRLAVVNKGWISEDEVKYWDEQSRILRKLLEKAGLEVVNGSANQRVSLYGPEGVHEHNKRYDIFLSFGSPSPEELMKNYSRPVGIQVRDFNMHLQPGESFNDTDTPIMKPNLVYLPDDMPNREGNPNYLQVKQYEAMIEQGTIRDDLDNILRVVKTPQELLHYAFTKTPIKSSIHQTDNGEEHVKPEIDPRLLSEGRHILRNMDMPIYNVAGYTSASKTQPREAMEEAYLYGKMLAERGFGNVHGGGLTGIMGEHSRGTVENGGVSIGHQCPYIVTEEGMPAGLAIMEMHPEIYKRQAGIFNDGQLYVTGVGGRGGGGTAQEAATGLYLYLTHSPDAKYMSNTLAKGVEKINIFDNRAGLFDNLIRTFEFYGFEQGREFQVANGTKEVMEHIDRHHQKVMDVLKFTGIDREKGSFRGK